MIEKLFAYDSPYAGGKLRQCTISSKSPTRYAKSGVNVVWNDTANLPEWVSRGGWQPCVFTESESAILPQILPKSNEWPNIEAREMYLSKR